MKFSVGDEVICISQDFYKLNIPKSPSPYDPKIGGVYTVSELFQDCLYFYECGTFWCYEDVCFEKIMSTDQLEMELQAVPRETPVLDENV